MSRKTRDVAGILHFLTPQQMAEEIVRLDAALSARSAEPVKPPEGWKLVPVEPTREMLEAAVKCRYGQATYKVSMASVEEAEAADDYRAMLDAAPRAALNAAHVLASPSGWMNAEGRVCSAAEKHSMENHQGIPGKRMAATFTTPLYASPPPLASLPGEGGEAARCPYSVPAGRLCNKCGRIHAGQTQEKA
jgi:hypothetical protein